MTFTSMGTNGVARVPSSVALLPKLVEWPKPTSYEFEERAAILEFDWGLSRAEAEQFARREMSERKIGN